MISLFFNSALIQHYYLIGISYGRESMCHHYYCAAFIKSIKILYYTFFIFCIKRICRFI